MSQLPEDEAISFINTVSGLTSVRRFHGHAVVLPQSVADHSSRVAMLAYLLALEFYGNEQDAYRVSTYALFHDFSEGILKNDANSAIKAKYGIRELLKKLEQDVVADMFSSETLASSSLRSLILEQCVDQDYQLLKIADTLDFGLYVWHEVGLGNNHLKPLLSAFIKEYNKYPENLRVLEIAKITFEKILTGI